MSDVHAIDEVLEEVVGGLGLPSASLHVRVDGAEVYHRTLGAARRAPYRPAVEDQAYDLASLTKALAASTTTASLLADRMVDLDDPVERHVPGVDPRVRVRDLLVHGAGFPAWRPLYEGVLGQWGTARARDGVLARAAATPLDVPPGSRHTYSDIGFLVLLSVIERAAGARLDRLVEDRILAPVGARDLRFGGWPLAAATEDCPVRGGVVEGTVHDLNCAAMGGVSSHAGLFGTARAVGALVDAMIDAAADRRGDLPGEAIDTLWSLVGPGPHRGGWDSVTPGASSTGAHFPPDTVGHLGYTGTSVWASPSRRAVVVLLTNRVHPIDDKEPIRLARPLVHDAVAGFLGWA